VGLVHVGHTFTLIVVGGSGIVDALDLKEMLVLVLLVLRSAETEEHSLHPKSNAFTKHRYLTGARGDFLIRLATFFSAGWPACFFMGIKI
jgi:hypothetical protein